MLLVLDVGNTNTVLGVFEGKKLIEHWRVATLRERTEDEHGILIKELLGLAGLSPEEVEGISISCVVPPLAPVLVSVGRKFFHAEPLLVGPGVKTGMPIHVDNPREVGADRIVNAVAAFEQVKGPVLVVDFGTATTFDFVSAKGAFEGGVIAPGLVISTEALFTSASKLPRVELVRPRKVIGKNTVAAMQSGILRGYAGLVEAIIKKMLEEIRTDFPGDPEPKVLATGGLARLLGDETESIAMVDDHLTLKGLQIIYERNQPEKEKRSP